MKITTLVDVYNSVCGTGGEVIEIPEETRIKAVKCIEKMIEYGG